MISRYVSCLFYPLRGTESEYDIRHFSLESYVNGERFGNVTSKVRTRLILRRQLNVVRSDRILYLQYYFHDRGSQLNSWVQRARANFLSANINHLTLNNTTDREKFLKTRWYTAGLSAIYLYNSNRHNVKFTRTYNATTTAAAATVVVCRWTIWVAKRRNQAKRSQLESQQLPRHSIRTNITMQDEIASNH